MRVTSRLRLPNWNGNEPAKCGSARSNQKMHMPLNSGRSLLLLVTAVAVAAAASAARADDDPWPDIQSSIFDSRQIIENDGTVTLEAPKQAEDAAIVPLTMRIPASTGDVKSLTLVIDKNPAPVAATFYFGEAAGTGERMLSTRVRVDRRSNVRAVIETADGTLHMATKFVRASGGCSAPAGKDPQAALVDLGKMRITTFDRPTASGTPLNTREAQVMIRHPNFTGMQMDRKSFLYTPARFVEELEVKRDGDLVFRMEGGISISENPNFRFTFAAAADETLEVTAKDTDGAVFAAKSVDKSS